MDDTPPEFRGPKQYLPEQHLFTYPPAVMCPECGGTGNIVLFVSAGPCRACDGSGRVRPPARHEVVRPAMMGYLRRERSYDEQGRVVVESLWFEPAGEEAEMKNEE